MISWLLAAVLNVGTLKYALGFLKQKSKILSALLKGRQCWFSSSWLHFCILDVTCFVWCFKFENQKDRRLIGFFLRGGKKVFAIIHNSKAFLCFAFGVPLQQAGFWSSLDTRFAALHVLSPFESDFKGSEVSFPYIFKRFSDCCHLRSICTLWIALPEGRGLTGNPEVMANSRQSV